MMGVALPLVFIDTIMIVTATKKKTMGSPPRRLGEGGGEVREEGGLFCALTSAGLLYHGQTL